jgi:Zn-finger nucleic acid-binding protein
MEGEKDRFGEKMRLVERAKEDIFFAQKDRELIEKLKARLKKVERPATEGGALVCLKCSGKMESYSFMEFVLDRCQECGGIWLDKGELEGVLKKLSRSPLAAWIERYISRSERAAEEEARR